MIKDFYNKFSARFIQDYVRGNARVDRQLAFFERAVPAEARSVLVIGCGSGEGAHHIAAKVATQAEVHGVDLSASAIAAGQRLFAHPRVTLQEADVFDAVLARSGGWDVIVFPDSYEHLPRARRAELSRKLDEVLAPGGRLLLTIPTPAGQQFVAKHGELQEIDEPVTLEDLVALANGVRAELSFYSVVSIWETNDYAHAVIERGSDEVRAIGAADRVPLKVAPRPNLSWRARRLLRRAWRRVHVARSL